MIEDRYMELFVQPNSIARRIWGDAEVVLLVFAGAAAEFALNRAVDWLFVTGALPADPIGRFFSTVAYAQKIVFADQAQAEQTLGKINAVHGEVEQKRGEHIPEWAYRDVLYMLIDYSERAFQVLYRSLTTEEQEELYNVFWRVGMAMHIPKLPENYKSWQQDRQRHLEQDLTFSPYTAELYAAYRRDLGFWRYILLRQLQSLLVPKIVHKLLDLPRLPWLRPAVLFYPLLKRFELHLLTQRALIPSQHLEAVQRLNSPLSMHSSPHRAP